MRVAIGGIYHESNTFLTQRMTLDRFAESALHYGREIDANWRGTASEMGGFLLAAEQFGFETVPTVMAWGMPHGTITADTFETLSEELISRLKVARPLDGVLLSLHGAMVSETFPDADGELLRRVRNCLGPNVPLVITVDFHANLTEVMVRWSDAIVGYDTYPHVDQVERAVESAEILLRIHNRGPRPRMRLERRPLLPHIMTQTTERPPMAEVMALAHELERRPGVLCLTVAAGFPYSDVPDAGFAVLAVAQDDWTADDAAGTVADFVWGRRKEFRANLPEPAEAVRAAIGEAGGLTVLVDIGDNLGAGTPGDGTILLAELVKQGARGALVLLADPEAVAICLSAGVRQRVRMRVGCKVDRNHGDPLEIEGCVRTLSAGVFRNAGPMREGIVEDQGRTAVIDTGGILVVLTERRMPMWNLEQLRSIGIDPARLRIIVVKAAIAHRAAYGPIAHRFIEVDTPGLSAGDVRKFNYKRLKRPIYPLDEI